MLKALGIICLAAVAARADVPEIKRLPHTDGELAPSIMAMVMQAQEEVLKPDFERARQLCGEAEKLAPEHPLPLMMNVGVRLYEIQESMEAGVADKKTYAEFYKKIEQLITMAELRETAYPLSPDPKMHLGAAYGCRGLVKLHQHKYLGSYRDGKKGVEYLQKAVALDSTRYDAYMGLGQFEYYCARLNGLLQFMLDLQGDEKKGIEKLQLCESKGTYAAWPARSFLVKVLSYDRRDWARLEPYLERVFKSFPRNYHHVRMVYNFALGQGMDKAKSREWMEQACAQWDAGWRPPAYVKNFGLEATRLELARSYAATKKTGEARSHLQALSHSEDPALVKLAAALLTTLK